MQQLWQGQRVLHLTFQQLLRLPLPLLLLFQLLGHCCLLLRCPLLVPLQTFLLLLLVPCLFLAGWKVAAAA